MQDPFASLKNRDEIVKRLNAMASGLDFFAQSMKDNLQAVITLLVQEINMLKAENERLKTELEKCSKKEKKE